MNVFIPCVYFVLEWVMYPNVCVSETNVNLQHTNNAAGNSGLGACKSECSKVSKCSAIEWYENTKVCHLMLSDVPAAKGSLGSRHMDIACYIRPGNGKMSQMNEII
jgi:hypothetical protein